MYDTRLYLVTCANDSKKFQQFDVVQLIAIINNAYLVEKLGTDEREWVMRYCLYPFLNHDYCGFHTYYKEYQKMIPPIYYYNSKTRKIVLNGEGVQICTM